MGLPVSRKPSQLKRRSMGRGRFEDQRDFRSGWVPTQIPDRNPQRLGVRRDIEEVSPSRPFESDRYLIRGRHSKRKKRLSRGGAEYFRSALDSPSKAGVLARKEARYAGSPPFFAPRLEARACARAIAPADKGEADPGGGFGLFATFECRWHRCPRCKGFWQCEPGGCGQLIGGAPAICALDLADSPVASMMQRR